MILEIQCQTFWQVGSFRVVDFKEIQQVEFYLLVRAKVAFRKLKISPVLFKKDFNKPVFIKHYLGMLEMARLLFSHTSTLCMFSPDAQQPCVSVYIF